MDTQELLWKYAEGTCQPSEIAVVEKLLAENPSLQSEMDRMLEVQSALINMESDAPSMRFTQNLMDALPEIYPSAAAESLVKPIWKKVFWIAVVAYIAAALILPRSGQQPSGDIASTYLEQFTGAFSQAMGQVPAVVLQYFTLTLLTLAFLMLMDRVVLKKVRGFVMF